MQEFELLKKLILDKDQEILFNKIPKPNLLEIVDGEDEIAKEGKKPLGEEINGRSNNQNNAFDQTDLDVVDRIKIQSDSRAQSEGSDARQVQESYNRLRERRDDSAFNNRLLSTLEEQVMKQRAERDLEREIDLRESQMPRNRRNNRGGTV